jgi:hypothetical protein
MGRPYPVPVQITTIYTESRGNVEVATAELRYLTETKFETALFWDADKHDPDDIGTVIVEVTTDKNMAYRNHKWWEDVNAIESRIHRAINDLRNQK